MKFLRQLLSRWPLTTKSASQKQRTATAKSLEEMQVEVEKLRAANRALFEENCLQVKRFAERRWPARGDQASYDNEFTGKTDHLFVTGVDFDRRRAVVTRHDAFFEVPMDKLYNIYRISDQKVN